MPAPLSLAATRARRLRQGINLSHWFSQVYWAPGYTPAHFDNYIRQSDMALIRDMGFDHVRFPINCEPIIAAATNRRLPIDYLARIRDRIGELLDHGLAVIVDIHPEDGFKKSLAHSDETLATFADFWTQFARALSHLDPERVIFEILNEPCIQNVDRWNHAQHTLVRAVRVAAPEHTLIICGDQWSQLPELLKITPPDDRNLIANFHLYDPSAFTHQGAHWLPSWAMHTKGLAYPTDPKATQELLAHVEDADARAQLADYIRLNWNADAYRAFIQPALTWARTYGLPLTCNEFGVYKKFSPRASRVAWIRDVSATLAAHDIGWTMWDYAGDFSIVTKQGDLRVPDIELLDALHLTSNFAPVA